MGTMKIIGDQICEHLRDQYVFEESGWARELVDRVSKRLQGSSDRFYVHVPWLSDFTAFTVPGGHIFISRQMLERCRTDEMVAMVLGHEMAHHDLGHLDALPAGLRQAAESAGPGCTALIWMLWRFISKSFYGQDRERAADLHGLDLCLVAGYNGSKCLEFFDIFEKYALDFHATDTVFGSEDEPNAILTNRFAGWLKEKLRSHPSVDDRKQMLREHLKMRQEGVNLRIDASAVVAAHPTARIRYV